MSKPCVFFDRDGIVNVSPGKARYVESVDGFVLQPEFLEALKIAQDRGYESVIVTNQRGVFIGRMTMESVREIHEALQAAVRKAGLRLLDIRVCTDGDDQSPRRKPNPGMLTESAEQHDLDLSRSWMVGDHEKDVVAGRLAGCQTIFVGVPEETTTTADHRVVDMKALVAFFRDHLPGVTGS